MSPNQSIDFEDEFEGGNSSNSIDPLAANDSELRHAHKVIRDGSDYDSEDGDGKINLDKELLGSAFNAFGSAINLGSVRNEFKADINELDPDQLDVIMENFISRT